MATKSKRRNPHRKTRKRRVKMNQEKAARLCQGRKDIISEAMAAMKRAESLSRVPNDVMQKHPEFASTCILASSDEMDMAVIRLTGAVKGVRGFSYSRLPEWVCINEYRNHDIAHQNPSKGVYNRVEKPVFSQGGPELVREYYGFSRKLNPFIAKLEPDKFESDIYEDFWKCARDADELVEEDYLDSCGERWRGLSAEDICRKRIKIGATIVDLLNSKEEAQ